jgi:dynein heavy chain
MQTLQEVRAKQSEIELDFIPITQMYKILEENLPDVLAQDKEEQEVRDGLTNNWAKLLAESESRQEEFSLKQVAYKKNLIKTVNAFKKDVAEFRALYDRHGPMVRGIPPREAVERLKRFKEEYDVRERKQMIYYLGEDLFGLPHQQYPKLDLTKQELAICRSYMIFMLLFWKPSKNGKTICGPMCRSTWRPCKSRSILSQVSAKRCPNSFEIGLHTTN